MKTIKVHDLLGFGPNGQSVHGRTKQELISAWELVDSIIIGLENGHYTFAQVKKTAQERLNELRQKPLPYEELKIPRVE